jgi:hypothetical protein
MSDVVIFHLAKHFPPLTPIRPYLHCAETLYEKIRKGDKTSEWRVATPYWLKRLVTKADLQIGGTEPQDLTELLKVHKAWFVEGYPKRNLPRLEAEISGLVYYPENKEFPAHSQQLEIRFKLIREVMTLAMAYAQEKNEELGRFLEQNRARMASFIFTIPLPHKIGASHFMDFYEKRRKQYVEEAVEKLRKEQKEIGR